MLSKKIGDLHPKSMSENNNRICHNKKSEK